LQAVRCAEGAALLIGTGTILSEVLKVADLLAARSVRARVESFHTVKPLDEERLGEVFGAFPLVPWSRSTACSAASAAVSPNGGRVKPAPRADARLRCEDSSCTRSDRRTTRAAGYGIDAGTIAERRRAALRSA